MVAEEREEEEEEEGGATSLPLVEGLVSAEPVEVEEDSSLKASEDLTQISEEWGKYYIITYSSPSV